MEPTGICILLSLVGVGAISYVIARFVGVVLKSTIRQEIDNHSPYWRHAYVLDKDFWEYHNALRERVKALEAKQLVGKKR